MVTEKKYYFLKLIPPRPTFIQDITVEEKNIMMHHAAYWKDKMNKGFVISFGPVFDPAGPYGVGIVVVESNEELMDFMEKDPANGLNRYEYHPTRAIVPDK
ncbi:MAG: YciI family protein [Bacteroidota bacterium]|nr:YciI family protein [Bacteroidota bacterium]